MATVRSKNPITDDANLMKLLEEAQTLDTEDAFLGWKENFLEQYMSYLDPDGVENAKNSNKRLAKSLEKLAASVVTVNEFVKDGTITKDSQSVQGKRRLTNMTDQMAQTEKEVARFLPTTGAEENEVGYDKFELGAVMIDDGFQVYEHLKTTKDIVENLQKVVLNDILPANKLSIIQFYIRQIEIFCAVMADLNLFKLMDQIVDMYAVRPRNRIRSASDDLPVDPVVPEPPSKPKRKEKVLDPNTNYTRRSAYVSGYFDPLSGTQPGREEFEDSEPESDDPEGEGEDDNEFMIFFDMKTGRIGKIPRRNCVEMKLIVTDKQNNGEEAVQGEIVDNDEKEQLLWDMKKALKANAKQASRANTPPRSKTPPKSPKVGVRRNNSIKKEATNKVSPPPETAGEHSPKVGVRRNNSIKKEATNKVSHPPEPAEEHSPKVGVRRNNSVKKEATRTVSPPPETEDHSPKVGIRRNKSDKGVLRKATSPPATTGDHSPKVVRRNHSSKETLRKMNPPQSISPDLSTKKSHDVSNTSRSPRSPKGETRENCTGASKPVKVDPKGNDSTDHKITLKAPSKAVVSKPSSQGWSSPGVLAAKRRVDK